MTQILWQSRSPVLFDSFQRAELINAANGGNAYDYQAADALSRHFSVHIDPVVIKRELLMKYWLRLKQHKPVADVFIMEPFPLLFGSRHDSGKSVAMIHHVDETELKKSSRHRIFLKQLKKRLPEMDLVVTVSRYWEQYMRNIGCRNVKVIYNSFDPSDYLVSEMAVTEFKNRHGLSADKPLVYIGNASLLKGVDETYQALKNNNYELVMTGSSNKATQVPVKFLNLNRADYITLLKAADVVVTMSKLLEGWNRVAHEALLSKTPVVGSGTGGMQELLEESKQQIVHNIQLLPQAVENAIQNKKSYGEEGYKFVSRLNLSYFENEWRETISQLVTGKN